MSRKCESGGKSFRKVLSAQKVPGRFLSHRSGCLLRSVEGSSSESSGMLKNQSRLPPHCPFKGGWVERLDAKLHHHYIRYAKSC